jgi:Magnesium chelatase, subunit ChlI
MVAQVAASAAEQAHPPTQQRGRRRQGLQAPGPAPRVLSADGLMAPHLRPRRHCLFVRNSRQEMTHRCQTWRAILGTAMAAYGPNKVSSSQLGARGPPQGALIERSQAGHAGKGPGESVTAADAYLARQAGGREALETPGIHGVAGLTGARTALVTARPFRAPHQTISAVGLVGGGHLPRPGEGSLAHHGILFLDERPECRRHVLEVLRQPLAERLISLLSPARPRSQCLCCVRCAAHDLKPPSQGAVAARHHHCGPDARAVTTSLLYSRVRSPLVFSA